ncbi:MAG: SDR family oxidoreductase [Alphaproteobacteria bacterium]|nr:SDR family oxidoreductase [Alphaproteobacteria bacterium]
MAEAKVAVIAAAGGGLGGAIARELKAQGYALALMSSGGSAEALAEELDAHAIRGSVTEPGDLERLVALAMDRFGRIDAVVNNTGNAPGFSWPTPAPFDVSVEDSITQFSDDDWSAALDILLLNVVRMARLVTPILQRQGGGAIVNISATGAKEPRFAFPLSSCLRAGLAAYMKMYADRHGRDGIRMNNVLPGLVNNYDWAEDVVRTIPLQRPVTVEEVAKTTAFLLSPDSGGITGQSVSVDGGLSRGI